LRAAKETLLDELLRHGRDERGNLIVARMRKPRAGVLGYYCGLSQFRGGTRLVVDIGAIAEALGMGETCPSEIADEIVMTLAHEYGHAVAELIEHAPRILGRFLAVPDWKQAFGDEEELAEDLARMICGRNCERGFWDVFIPAYVRAVHLLMFAPPHPHAN
jgi:hypothetical protein